MQQLQVSVPAEHTEEVLGMLRESPGLATLGVLRGASQRPAGDLVLAQIARESVDGIVEELRKRDFDSHGTITILDSAKSGSLVGVFISVTTVPAAGNLALAIALANGREIRSSLTQLGLNVVALLVAGMLTLLVQKVVWRHVPAVRPRGQRRLIRS